MVISKGKLQELLTVLDEMVGKEANVIEDDPEEGLYCFHCKKYNGNLYITYREEHEDDCPVVRARKLLKEFRRMLKKGD